MVRVPNLCHIFFVAPYLKIKKFNILTTAKVEFVIFERKNL